MSERGIILRIMNYDDLISHGNIEGRKIAVEILEAVLEASRSLLQYKTAHKT
jgi:hypothetical protein